MDAWSQIGKTIGVLTASSFDFAGLDAALKNLRVNSPQFQTEQRAAREAALTTNIAAAQQMAPTVVDTGLARTPEGEMIPPTSSVPSFGTVDYSPRAAGAVAEVEDPAQTFADIARRQGEFKRGNIRPFEEALIQQLRQGGDELVAQAPLDVARQATKVEGIAKRNISRYGFKETGATQQARDTAQTLARTVAVTDAVNNARLDQDASNKQLLNVLVNAGSSVQQMGLNALGSAATMQGSRDNAYRQAQAGAKAQRYGFIGSLFSMI